MEMEMEKKRGRVIDDDELKVLPPDIITDILSRLPADSVKECRCICKQWRSLIDDPCFVDAHTRRLISSSSSSSYNPNSSCASSSSGFLLYAEQDGRIRYNKLELIEYNDGGCDDDEEKSVLRFKPSKPNPIRLTYENLGEYNMRFNISSCNGLVFMGSSIDMFIYNPFTKDYMNLRTTTKEEEKSQRRLGWSSLAYGFGYHLSTNEYKVVKIYYDERFAQGNKEENMAKVSVYTLGSGKWRNKTKRITYNLLSGLFANGAIHWITSTGEQIVSFDLADEEFRVVVPVPVLQPSLPESTYMDYQYYGVLDGCLCVTAKCESSIDIWVLNVPTTNNNNNKEEEFSWNKKFSIPWKGDPYAKPLVVTKSGKILLLCVDGYTGCTLVSYDPKTEAFVYGNKFPHYGWDRLVTYTKSFVSLKALGEEDARHWGSMSVAHV